jgi:hypothetical protein
MPFVIIVMNFYKYNIAHFMHCACSHLHTNVHKEIICYTLTSTHLHVSAINCYPQGDTCTKEYVILLHQSHMDNVKI